MITTGKNDIELIIGLHKGEETAISRLYDMNYKGLCYYADRMLQNTAEAEDVSTESFLKLLNKKENFHNTGQVRTFLYKVTHNACVDILRKNKRADNHKKQWLPLIDGIYSEAAESELTIAKVLQLVYTEIERLPAQCKKVFQYTFFEGKSTAEVAAIMEINSQTVLNQKNKALAILRGKIDKEGLYQATVFSYCIYLLCTR